ncbi:MAG: disulfide bond formation protein DsbD [Bacteroidetes bacterium GWE2_29_8]|nr:MAG: disulfide bond formation protein DsbD [Bacteroidetes bacterium GWE2_29_8]OFY21753.1 MAG: disulfide bond formation protein DsbD [Bacteroidetes bacterium GWF2_29_10]
MKISNNVTKFISVGLFAIILNFIFISSFSQVFNPIKWSYSYKNINDSVVELNFIAKIDKNWHLYSQFIPENGPVPTSFSIEKTDNFKLIGAVEEPKPKKELDENFSMVLKYFVNEAIFTQKILVLSNKPFTIKGSLEFMCCDNQRCLPPKDESFEFKINGRKNLDNKANIVINKEISPKENIISENAEISKVVVENKTTQLKINKYKANNEESNSLLAFFIFAFLGGLAAILTPCVFPMIPMTVTFFMHGKKTPLQSKIEASIYGVSIIAIYTIVGTLIAITLGPDFANWLSTHWIPNVFFFFIFLFFAASFLGMFEIVLPTSLVNKTDKMADRGGYLGAFFMALTLVLVSFSCTGPIVGAILVQSASGEFLKPIIGMFGFALAFAIPFTLFSFFPNWLNKLPKSGGWLNSVKVVLGFLELALGLKFLSIADQTYHWGILDREIYLAFWIVIFGLLGMYLLGKIKLPHDSDSKHIGVPRLITAIITLSFVVYLIPGMFGAPLKALSGYLPPQATHDFDINNIIRNNAKLILESGNNNSPENISKLCEKPKYTGTGSKEDLHLPHGLEGYFDIEQAMSCAKKLNKPVFIDFTGHGCVNCREMEAKVWSNPEVLRRLKNNFVIVALYVDDKKELPESEWVKSTYDNQIKKTLGKKYADYQITKFNVNAQPYYVILDTSGNILIKPKAYDLNIDNFIKFLDEAIDNFKDI